MNSAERPATALVGCSRSNRRGRPEMKNLIASLMGMIVMLQPTCVPW